MSQQQHFPRSSVCRRLVFDEEPTPENLPNIDENPQQEQVHDGQQSPQHLEEARLDNIHNTFIEVMKKSREDARKKWNFDFETETPLDGDWEWEIVDNNENLGARYHHGRDIVQENGKY